MKNFFFQIVRSDEGCRSYVLADSDSKKGLIWDPTLASLEAFVELVSEWGLKEVMIVDSHTHADHFSASAELESKLAPKLKVEIAMNANTQSKRPTRRLRDGESINLGPNFKGEVLATPGHTEDSICFVLSYYGEKILLSGDTLMIGAAGRTDFPGASAEKLYDSLQRLSKLPGTTWVFPAHDYSGLLFSNIETEKRVNTQLRMTKEEFILFKQNEILDCAPIVTKIVDFNNAEKPKAPLVVPAAAMCARSGPAPTVRAVGTDELKSLIAEKEQDVVFIDVREPDEYRSARIPGLENIPMSQIWLHFDDLKRRNTVYFSCQSGRRSGMVAATLSRIGVPGAVNVAGGIQGWMARGYHVDGDRY